MFGIQNAIAASKTSRTAARVLSATAIAALLSACGGGSAIDATDLAPPSNAPATVQGYVVKGPVAEAYVCAYPITSGKINMQTGLGCGSADAQGFFRFYVQTDGATVALVTKDRMGQYADELTGAPTTLGASLRSAVRIEAQGQAEAMITPFTEIALRRAETAAIGLNEQSIKEAMAQVALAFDLPDLRSTRPASATTAADWKAQSPQARKYGLGLAGVSAMKASVADSGSNRPALAQVLDKLSSQAFVPNRAPEVEGLYQAGLATFLSSPRNATGIKPSQLSQWSQPALAQLSQSFGSLPAIDPVVVPSKPNDGPACMVTLQPLAGNLAHSEARICVRKVEATQCNGPTLAPVLAEQSVVQTLFKLGNWSVSYSPSETCEVPENLVLTLDI
jgi:hypothetical protein